MLVAITSDLITAISGYQKENFHEVKSLDLHLREEQGKIKTIENLHMSPNLVQLNLSYNLISKIEGLSYLHQLLELNLAENMISRIEGLENLKLLEKLNLSGNQIQRIPSTISTLKRLTHFRIARNNLNVITDLLYLKSLQKLVNIRIDENPISKLEHYKVYVVFHITSVEVFDGEEVEVDLREKALQRYAHDTISQLEHTLLIKQHVLKKLKLEIQSSPLRKNGTNSVEKISLSPSKKNSLNTSLSLKFQEMQSLEEDMVLIRTQIQEYYKNPTKSGSFMKLHNNELKSNAESLQLHRSSSPILPFETNQEENQNMLLSPILPSKPNSNEYTTPVFQATQLKTIDKEKQQYQQSAIKHIENLEQDLRMNQQQLEEALRMLQDINTEYSNFQVAHNEIIDDYKKQINDLKIDYENDLKELEETFQYAQSQWDKERASVMKQNEEVLTEKDNTIKSLSDQVKSFELELNEKHNEILEHKEVLNKLVSNMSTSTSSSSGWLSPGPVDKISSFSAGVITPIPVMMNTQHSGKLLASMQQHEYQQHTLELQRELNELKQKYSQSQSQYDLLSMQYALLVEAQQQWFQKEQSLKDDLKANDDALHKKMEELMQLKFQLQQSKFTVDDLQHEKHSFEHQKQQLLKTIEILEKDMQAVIAAKQPKLTNESISSFHPKRSPQKHKRNTKTSEDVLSKNYFEIVSTDSEKEDENGNFAISGPGILFPNPTPRKAKLSSQQLGSSSIQTKAEKENVILKTKKLLFSPLEKHAAEIVAHILIEEILQSSNNLRSNSRKTSNSNDNEVILWNAYTMRDCCLRAAIRLVYFSNNIAAEVGTSTNDQDQNTTSSEESVEMNLLESSNKKKLQIKKISITPFHLLADRKYLSHLVSELQIGLTTIEDSNALKVEIQQLQKIIGELETKASYVHSTIDEKEKVMKTLDLHAQEAKQQALDTLNELNQYHQKLQSLRSDYNKIEQELALQRQQYELQQKQLAELNLQKQTREQEIHSKQESYVVLYQQETQLKQSLLTLQEKIALEEKYYKQHKLKASDELHDIVNQVGQHKLMSQKQEELFLQSKKYSVQYEEELNAKSIQIKQQIQSFTNEKQELAMHITSLKQEVSQLKLTKDKYLQDQDNHQNNMLTLQDALQSLKQEEKNKRNEIQRLEDSKRKLREIVDQLQQDYREEKKLFDDSKQKLTKEIENYQLMKQENQLQYEQVLSKQQQYVKDQLDLRTSLEQQVKSMSQEQQNLMYKIESFQYEISQLQKKSEELTAQIQSQERQKVHHANQKHLLEKQYSQNQTNLQQLKTEITDCKVTLQQQKTQISLLDNEITSKQQAIAQIQTNISQLQSVEQRLSNTIKDYYHQNEELVYQLNQQKHILQCEDLLIKEKQFVNTQLRDEISDLEKKKDEFLQESKNLSTLCQDARKKVDSNEQQIVHQEKTIHQKTMQLQSLELQKSSIEDEIAVIQRNMTKYQNQLSTIQTEISTSKQSAQQIKQQSLMQGSQFSNIQEEYNSLMERLREHQVEQQSLINQQALLLQENKSLEQQKHSLQSQLRTSEKQLQTAIDQLNATENRMLALEQSISMLQSSKQQLSHSIQQDQMTLKKLHDAKDKEEDQLHKLKDEVHEQHSKVVSLQQQQQQDVLSYQKQKQQQQHQLIVLADSQKRMSERNFESDSGVLPFRTTPASSNLDWGIKKQPLTSQQLENKVNLNYIADRLNTSPTNRFYSKSDHSSPKNFAHKNAPYEKVNFHALHTTDDTHSVSSQDDVNSYGTNGSNDIVVFATLQQAVQNLRQQSQAVLTSSTTPMLSSGAPITQL